PAQHRDRRGTRRERQHHGGTVAAGRELHPGQLRAGTGSRHVRGRTPAGLTALHPSSHSAFQSPNDFPARYACLLREIRNIKEESMTFQGDTWRAKSGTASWAFRLAQSTAAYRLLVTRFLHECRGLISLTSPPKERNISCTAVP